MLERLCFRYFCRVLFATVLGLVCGVESALADYNVTYNCGSAGNNTVWYDSSDNPTPTSNAISCSQNGYLVGWCCSGLGYINQVAPNQLIPNLDEDVTCSALWVSSVQVPFEYDIGNCSTSAPTNLYGYSPSYSVPVIRTTNENCFGLSENVQPDHLTILSPYNSNLNWTPSSASNIFTSSEDLSNCVTFDGWKNYNTNATYNCTDGSNGTCGTVSIGGGETLFAHCNWVQYPVVYNDCDGNPHQASNPVVYGATWQMPSYNSATGLTLPSGYSFDGWRRSGTTYSDGDSFTLNDCLTSDSQIVFDAVCTQRYTVTYHSGNCSISQNYVSSAVDNINHPAYGDSYTVLSPSNQAISSLQIDSLVQGDVCVDHFVGWRNLDIPGNQNYDYGNCSNGGTCVPTMQYNYNSDLDLYAYCELTSSSVTYVNCDGTSITRGAQYGDSVESFSQPGYTFNGWLLDWAGGQIPYTVQTFGYEICSPGNLVLHADCAPKNYRILYMANEHGVYPNIYQNEVSFGPGVNAGGATYGQNWSTKSFAETGITPVAGYVFCGWSANPSDSCGANTILAENTTQGICTYDGDNESIFSYLYAIWECDTNAGYTLVNNACVKETDTTVNLRWLSNGGTGSLENYATSCTYSSGTINLGQNLTRPGYSFNGWKVTDWECPVPQIDSNTSAISRGNRDNSGALDVVPSSDTAHYNFLTENNTWAIRFTNFTVTGMAKCSSVSTDDPGNTQGKYCWCKVTGYRPDSGEVCNMKYFQWVYDTFYENNNLCLTGCSYKCSQDARYNTNKRAEMLTQTQ